MVEASPEALVEVVFLDFLAGLFGFVLVLVVEKVMSDGEFGGSDSGVVG